MSEKYPKLKFGEITVQHDDTWIKQAFRYFNYETKIDPTAPMVILFHDTNEIISTMDIVPDKTLIYAEPLGDMMQPTTINVRSHGLKTHTDQHDAICMERDVQGHPTTHLDINIGTITMFKRNYIVDKNNVRYLKGFSDIYNNKYKIHLPDASGYNCVYYIIDAHYPDLERVVLSIFKRKYGTDNYRFLFSYDPEIITKQQTENILYRLLTG